jgi:hypothetical protein
MMLIEQNFKLYCSVSLHIPSPVLYLFLTVSRHFLADLKHLQLRFWCVLTMGHKAWSVSLCFFSFLFFTIICATVWSFVIVLPLLYA